MVQEAKLTTYKLADDLTEVKLSILITSIDKRCIMLMSLVHRLMEQAEGLPVEIITSVDDCKIPVGGKRQQLLNNAVGEYVCFIDDDDVVSDKYVRTMLMAMDMSPDIVCFKALKTDNGVNPHVLTYSLDTHPNAHKVINGEYCRHPSHLCPVKRDLAQQCKFPIKSYGEDEEWIRQVLKQVKTQVFIDEVMYFYRFDTSLSETWRLRRDRNKR
jgi:glycosyltransferase involved in cell wall biosynthesis